MVEYTFDHTGTWTSAEDGVDGVTFTTSPLNPDDDRSIVIIPTTEPRAFVR